MDKAQGNLTYRLRVVPSDFTISRPVTATKYNVTGLRANTSYTVYVRAVSSGLYGPEESVINTTGKSECCINLSRPSCKCIDHEFIGLLCTHKVLLFLQMVVRQSLVP